MRLRNLTLVAVPLAALVIAGCGGGGSDSTSTPVSTVATTTAPSKEELISRGDAICAEVNAAVGTVGQSSEEGASQVGQVADLYIGMVESLKGIGAPEESAGYAEFIAAAEELSKIEGEAKLADEREDSAALGEAETKAITALASFESAAESYGFEECGQEPSAPTSTSTSTESSSEAEEAAPEEEAVEPEVEAAPEEEAAPEGGGAGTGGGGEAPAGEGSGGSSSGGVGPG
jgi:outer membrane murein-binding lipoprotein Lpp